MLFLQCRYFGLFLVFSQALASAATTTVGPTGTYATPCAALTTAQNGDVIEIDAAGNYTGDVCGFSASGLTIRGVNGRPHIDAGSNNAQGKAIWVIGGNDVLIENIEMSGATVPSNNGAAIREEGTNLNIRNCYFHNNQEGILVDDNLNSSILIEYSEFSQNGFGDGYTHNMYIGNIQQFTLQFSYSHLANVGHLVKSRAATNYILYNRLTDETGTASYELDLPNGGLSYVIGNSIQQSPTTQNPIMLAYLEEGATSGNPSHSLYVVNNTFVNNHTGGAYFVYTGAAATTPALLENNFFGGGGTITNQSNAVLTTNYVGTPLFVNSASYDYHLLMGSPGIDAGTLPGSGSGFSLIPVDQYLDPTCGQLRNIVGTIDIGAFEYNGAGPLLGCTLNPIIPQIGNLNLSQIMITAGTTTTGNTVGLTSAAGPSGATVDISSSDPHAQVPATVNIPGGQSSATFSITTSAVSAPTVARISGSAGGQTLSKELTIIPASPALASLTLASTSIAGGATLNGNLVTLTAPVPSGGVGLTVSLVSGSPALLSVPTSVTIPAGATSETFSITAGAVTAPTSVSITASYAGKTCEGFVTIEPTAHRGFKRERF